MARRVVFWISSPQSLSASAWASNIRCGSDHRAQPAAPMDSRARVGSAAEAPGVMARSAKLRCAAAAFCIMSTKARPMAL